MRAKFFMGPKDGAEGTVQTSNGFAPNLYQHPVSNTVVTAVKLNLEDDPLKEPKRVVAYYDLQKVKEGVAYYKYRCTA